mgnify:CR=1 FL=1
MKYKKITETSSNHDDLELMNTKTILSKINDEDKKVAFAVEIAIPQITKLVEVLAQRFQKGGRLIYIGAGTSGRLGILDASEIPPTYGMPYERVIGLIAGGDTAIRKAVEHAEDDYSQAWLDLKEYDINLNDTILGIAASGSTPYVVGGLEKAKENGVLTASICNNPNAPISKIADIPIEIIVGPEFVTGSTRMKSGTSQKLVLNMISTALMIKIGKVKGNKMVNMQLSNDKLVDRGTRYLIDSLEVDYKTANEILTKYGSVRLAIENYKNSSL